MIDPLTALATFNAACAVVKEAKDHAGDITAMFKGIGQMMSAKQEIEKAVKSNPDKSDLELYAAHAEMEQKWQETIEVLKWTGHWEKYLKFCSDRREAEKQQRIAEIRAKNEKARKIKEIALALAIVVGTLSAIGIVIWLLWLVKNKGAI